MPLYESDTLTREELDKKRKYNVCAECGEWLNTFLGDEGKVFIACKDFLRTHHEGIARENNELREKNIPTRRKNMEDKFGQEKTRALAKYQMTGVINRDAAEEIVETLWKGASPVDKTKAIILCSTYNLNPLMNHLFMLPFQNKKTGKTDYAVVIGIEATRLMVHRKHKFTYLDLTPRKATTEELEKILGKENIKPNTFYVITKGKDLETGAEGYGLGAWSGPVYGEDKGNSAFNMSSIRSERQFFKRMYPAEQPAGVDVVDERFVDSIEGEYREVDETTGEIKDKRGEFEKEGKDLIKEATAKKPQAKTTVADPKEGPEDQQKAPPSAVTTTGTPPEEKPKTQGQKLVDAMSETGYTEDEIKEHIGNKYVVTSLRDLTPAQLKELTSDVLNYQIEKQGKD